LAPKRNFVTSIIPCIYTVLDGRNKTGSNIEQIIGRWITFSSESRAHSPDQPARVDLGPSGWARNSHETEAIRL
jgi:hypothetical protein